MSTDPLDFTVPDAVAMLAGLVEDGRPAEQRLAERRAVEAKVLRDFATITEATAPLADGGMHVEGARALILGAADMARTMAEQLEGPDALAPLRAMIEHHRRGQVTS